jgi:hypothetical protein
MKAALGTLDWPTAPMCAEGKATGFYTYVLDWTPIRPDPDRNRSGDPQERTETGSAARLGCSEHRRKGEAGAGADQLRYTDSAPARKGPALVADYPKTTGSAVQTANSEEFR